MPYDAFRPEFTRVMDGLSRGLMDEQLIDGILPVTGDLPARLAAGVPAADIGCGPGHAVNLLARAFPASRFTGLRPLRGRDRRRPARRGRATTG